MYLSRFIPIPNLLQIYNIFRNTAKYDITVRRQFAFPSYDYERVDGYFPSKYIAPIVSRRSATARS